MWLAFHREIVGTMLNKDILLVLGRGLGIQKILASFVKLYSSKGYFVFVLNANEEAMILVDNLLSQGVKRHELPVIINNRSSATERMKLYKKGGCFFVTSRILIVDMLNNRINRKLISGLLINQAHRVSETSIESFIVRVYREENKDGFVKAFTENSASINSGFSKLEEILKQLYIRDVLLYPRFHLSISENLEKHQPEVYEIEQPLSSAMKTIQESILVALEACLNELKKSAKQLDASDLTVNNALLKSIDLSVRKQLDPIWFRLPPKTKQLVSDLGTLRQLLMYLTRYDAITFHSLLQAQKIANGQQSRNPSLWLYTEAADRLFKAANERLYKFSASKISGKSDQMSLKMILEHNPKWQALVEILIEIEDEILSTEQKKDADKIVEIIGGTKILVMAKDERTCAQLREYLSLGGDEMMKRRMIRFILQRSGGGVYSTKDELLIQWAEKTLKEMELSIDPPQDNKKNLKMTAKKKKRIRILEEALQGSCHTEVSSYGMSTEELEFIKLSRNKDSSSDHLNTENSKRMKVATDCRSSKISQPIIGEMLCQDHCVICSYDHAHKSNISILESLQPKVVILYDPDVEFVRELEIFNAERQDAVIVYFLVYEESAEQQAYLSELRREKEAFEKLIQEKSRLLLPSNMYHVLETKTPRLGYSMDTRKGGRQLKKIQPSTIVIDVREFRSALPSLLYKEKIQIKPITLEVGDYILSPDICVERKSVSDLFGSFASGRLFNQAESMCRYYKIPVLLIEFSPDKPFSLQNSTEVGEEISQSSIISKMTLLVLHFPKLRILWSRSPHCTVNIFKQLKEGRVEPDVEVCASIGSDNLSETIESSQKFYNVTSHGLLRRLPGINPQNLHKVTKSVKNLAELCKMSVEELSPIIGTRNAKQLYFFLNKKY